MYWNFVYIKEKYMKMNAYTNKSYLNKILNRYIFVLINIISDIRF